MHVVSNFSNLFYEMDIDFLFYQPEPGIKRTK
jgi:hypothetical protein